jgi:two-component system sensor histidine kinase CpxA
VKLGSIANKVVAWSLGILTVSTVASWWISGVVLSDAFEGAFTRSDAFELSQAIAAYDRGGASEVRKYMDALHAFEGPERFVTDASGRDLATGEDRSAMLADTAGKSRSFRRVSVLKMSVRTMSPDGRYFYVVLYQAPHRLSTFAPHFFLLLAVVVLLFWALTMELALPLRRLAGAVRRFGAGDLTVRIGVHRKDDIGEVERAFDSMADRIQTLLTAERQLLQDVSHELRSPLARLRLAADVVARAGDREAAALRLRRETERLSDLVDSLLQMTTAEGDPAAFNVEEVSLSDILRDVVFNCELEAAERGCSIQVETPDDLHTTGDAEMLHRAIENVVRNAIRYSPPGAAVETRIGLSEGRIVVEVRDYGPGVPEDQLSKIFNPFFRVDESREASSGGIGLGLSIARRAIRLHHGELCAENAHPGLRVSIVLPAPDRQE